LKGGRKRNAKRCAFAIKDQAKSVDMRGTVVLPHKPIVCRAYAAGVPVTRRNERWLIHPRLLISLTLLADFMGKV